MPSALSTYMSTYMSFAVSAAILRSCLLVRTFQDLVSLRRATPWAWRRWRAVPPSGVDHEAHFPPVARRRFVDRSHVPDWVLVGFLVQIIYPCDSFCSPCLEFFFFFFFEWLLGSSACPRYLIFPSGLLLPDPRKSRSEGQLPSNSSRGGSVPCTSARVSWS